EKNRDQARMLVEQAGSEARDLETQARQGRGVSARQQASILGSRDVRAAGIELSDAEGDLGVLLLDHPSNDVSVLSQKDRVGRTRQRLYDAIQDGLGQAASGASAEDQESMRDRLYHEVLARSVRARRSRLAGYVGQFERRLETTPGPQLAL